jgi:very-short-patch-repair endonuclease
MAVCLAAGPATVASHGAAAGLHGFPGFLPGALEVTAFGVRTPRLRGVRCHASTRCHPHDLQAVQGIPATSAARTVVDLAGLLSPSLLERAVEHVLRRSLCTAGELALAFRSLAGRGRPGTPTLRRLLEDRLDVDSSLESRWLRCLRRAGLVPPARQHQVVVGPQVLLVDFAWPDQRVGLEVDGWEPHRHRSSWDRDHDKVNAYQEAGWKVMFVTSNTSEAKTIRQLRSFLCQYPSGFR